MAAQLAFTKVTVLPNSYTPNTMYLVNSGGVGEIWVSDSSGTTVTKFGGGTQPADSAIHPFMLMGAVQ